LVGLEVADLLASKGKQVSLVEMLPEVGRDMDTLAKSMLLRRLEDHAVVIRTDTKITAFTAKTVFAQQNDHGVQFPIETIVIAVGVIPSRELVAPLEQSGVKMYVIGDAVQPRKALEAIREGYEVAIRL